MGLVVLGACGDRGSTRPPDGIDDGDGGSAAAVDGVMETGGTGDGYRCALLGDEDCAADPRCRPIMVQAIVPNESCVLPPAVSGCAAREFNGPTLRAFDSYTREFLILGGCLAYEWTPAAGSTTLAACEPCERRSIDQCRATSYCQVVEAEPIDDLRSCVQAAQVVSCALGTLRCEVADTRATDPAGKEWAVAKACVPPGWSAKGDLPDLRACRYPTGPEVCASLSVRDCPVDASCRLLWGKPIAILDACALATQPVGCVRADATCGDTVTRARDENQTSWIFPSTCIPPDWRNESGPLVSDCPPARQP